MCSYKIEFCNTHTHTCIVVAGLISVRHPRMLLYSYIYSTAIVYILVLIRIIKLSGCSLNLLKQHQSSNTLLVWLFHQVSYDIYLFI